MVKLLEVIGRRADFTHEAFIEYQATTHLEVVEQVPEFLKPVRQYMQNHLLIDPGELAPIKGLPITSNTDSIIEVWYDNVDAIRQAFQEPRYFEILRPDELAFGDVEGVWGVTTNDFPVMERDGFSGHVKMFIFLKRKTGLTHAQFLAQWHDIRDQRLITAKIFRHVGRFVENRNTQDPAERLPGMRDYDLVAELWFESPTTLTEFASDVEIAAIFLKTDFADPGSTLIYVAEEKPETAEWLRRSQSGV